MPKKRRGSSDSDIASDGNGAKFRVACSALIERGGEYLLARRRDIGLWNLPGGGMEAGETVEDGLAREVMEEIGVTIRVVRLVGVYSKPQKNEIVLTFLCKLASDQEPGTSDEVSEVGWFRARPHAQMTPCPSTASGSPMRRWASARRSFARKRPPQLTTSAPSIARNPTRSSHKVPPALVLVGQRQPTARVRK